MMATMVFALCVLTSFACGFLLYRGYRKTGARLLFWSSVCFFGFAMNNALLIVDSRILPDVDLSAFLAIPVLLGLGALLYGLIWESTA